MTGIVKVIFGQDVDGLTLIVGVWLGVLGTSFYYVLRTHTR